MSRLTPEMSWQEKVAVLGEGCHPRVIAVLNSLAIGDEKILDVIDRLVIAADIDHLYDAYHGNLSVLTILLVLADADAAGLSAEKLLHAARHHGAGISISTIVSQSDEIARHMERYHSSS